MLDTLATGFASMEYLRSHWLFLVAQTVPCWHLVARVPTKDNEKQEEKPCRVLLAPAAFCVLLLVKVCAEASKLSLISVNCRLCDVNKRELYSMRVHGKGKRREVFSFLFLIRIMKKEGTFSDDDDYLHGGCAFSLGTVSAWRSQFSDGLQQIPSGRAGDVMASLPMMGCCCLHALGILFSAGIIFQIIR